MAGDAGNQGDIKGTPDMGSNRQFWSITREAIKREERQNSLLNTIINAAIRIQRSNFGVFEFHLALLIFSIKIGRFPARGPCLVFFLRRATLLEPVIERFQVMIDQSLT